MLLFDIFITTFRQARLAELSTDFLVLLSSHAFSQQDLEQALAREQQDYRLLYYDLPREQAGQAQQDYKLFLQECRAALGSQRLAFILPIALNYLSEQGNLEACCELLDYNLSDQKQAIAIAPLGRCFISQPVLFAAFLIWLMHREAKVDDILASYIMQDYALYHLVDDTDTFDPRQFLYQTLLGIKETKKLAKAMPKTSCFAPDAEDNLAYFALNGESFPQNSLNIIERAQVSASITSKKHNINALDRLFGVNFVVYALENPNCLRSLQRLLKHNVQDILVRIKENSKTVLDLIATYNLLLEYFIVNEIKGAYFVFKSLIEATMLAAIDFPCVLDDHILFINLRNFKDSAVLVPLYVEQVENELLDLCMQEPFDIVDITDGWKRACRKISALKNIFSRLETNVPANIFKLYGYLAKLKHAELGVWFNFRVFLNKINIIPEYGTQDISEYERLLIELLFVLNSSNLREEIITELEAVIPAPRTFLETNYTNFSFLQQAVINANLGMVIYLRKNGFNFSRARLNESVSIATENAYWPIVTYLYRKFDLDQDVINAVLTKAVAVGDATVVSQIFMQNKLSPSLDKIEKEFLNAAENGKIACLAALLECPSPPCITVIIKALNHSLEKTPPAFKVAKFLLKYKTENVLFTDAIRTALLKASRMHGSMQIITLLKNNPAITQKIVDQAFINAVRSGQSENATCIRTFGIIKPTRQSIDKAYNKPGKSRLEQVEDHLPSLNNSHGKKRNRCNYKRSRVSSQPAIERLPSIETISIANLAKYSYFEQSLDEPASGRDLDKYSLSMPRLVRNESC